MTATNLSISDVLLHMIVTLLTPMFLTTTNDLDQAYAAALATVRSCTARNPMDLLLIGQMIAFGLATLNSVSLSMEDNIPIMLILRLRGNAVSLHRASDKCRRALPEPDSVAACDARLTDAELRHEAEVIAEVERTRKRVAEYQASHAQPQASPAPTNPSIDTKFNLESNLRATWALAFPDATHQELDAVVKEAMAEAHAGSTHAAATDPSPSHPINSSSPPPGWSPTAPHFPDNRDTA